MHTLWEHFLVHILYVYRFIFVFNVFRTVQSTFYMESCHAIKPELEL